MRGPFFVVRRTRNAVAGTDRGNGFFGGPGGSYRTPQVPRIESVRDLNRSIGRDGTLVRPASRPGNLKHR
jgi:hypothetical protein